MNILERTLEFDFVKNSLNVKNTPFALFGVECDEGWSNLVYDLCKEMNDLGFKGSIVQIKEKFGMLRFYIDGGNDKIYELINKAEDISGTICEVCGKEGKCLNDRGWLLTRCEECYKEK